MSKVEWGFNRIGNTGLKVGLTVLLLGSLAVYCYS